MPGPALQSIGQISIIVQDIARATAFYRDTLGLRLLMEFPGMAFFDCGGVRLYLSRADKPELDHPASIIYYRTSDIRASHAALTTAGVQFMTEPHMVAKLPDHELWLADFRDSENNILCLMSEVKT